VTGNEPDTPTGGNPVGGSGINQIPGAPNTYHNYGSGKVPPIPSIVEITPWGSFDGQVPGNGSGQLRRRTIYPPLKLDNTIKWPPHDFPSGHGRIPDPDAQPALPDADDRDCGCPDLRVHRKAFRDCVAKQLLGLLIPVGISSGARVILSKNPIILVPLLLIINEYCDRTTCHKNHPELDTQS